MSGQVRATQGPTRRRLLAGGSALLAFSAASCDALSTAPNEKHGGQRTAPKAKEAQSLTEQVKAGKLPPLAKRLPREPLVITPVDGIGSYGGTWRNWLQGPASSAILWSEIGYDNLVRWDPAWTKVIPNVIESWDINDHGREYVFHLRQGMKWSDGEPFTAADFAFAYNDVLLNTDLYPVPPSNFTIDQKPAALKVIDGHTVSFVFPQPSGLFLEWLATPTPGNVITIPKHYMEQFHKKYTSDADKLAKKAGFKDWVELFGARNNWEQNPDLPTLNAWVVTKPLGAGTAGAQFERNPYYWKVDPTGKQLPYIDKVAYSVFQDVGVAVLNTANGELDFNEPLPWSGVCAPAQKPVLSRSRTKGGYRFIEGTSAGMNRIIIFLNLTHKDKKMREMFNNRDFRIGLSYAINRDEITDTVFQRQGEPWQAAPRKESEFYDQEMAKQYTEHDVAQANAHLDKAGYGSRDSKGFRLRPDGQRVAFSVDVSTETPEQADTMELVRKYWKDVGVDMQVKTMDRTLFYTRKAANLHDADVWVSTGGQSYSVFLDPRDYFPYSGESNFALPWATWYTSYGTQGEKPPAPARQQMELFDRLKHTIDKPTRHDLMTQLLQISKEQFWVIGTVLDQGIYGTVKDTFHNVPKSMPAGWMCATPGPNRAEQYYISGNDQG